MFKYKQILIKILSLLSFIILISACIYSVQEFSLSFGLFDNVHIQISGNVYIDTQLIKSKIHPQMSSSLLAINLTDIQNKLEFMDYIVASNWNNV